MQIKIKLEDSKLVGIDIYELEDSSLETTLATILGTYTPSLSTRNGASATPAVVPEPISVSDFNHTRPDGSMYTRADSLPNLAGMSDEDWEQHLEGFQDSGDAEALTRWLDGVFFPNSGSEVVSKVFRKAHTIYHLVNEYPEVTRRISLERWTQLAEVLGETEALPSIAPATARTYYNLGLRLTT